MLVGSFYKGTGETKDFVIDWSQDLDTGDAVDSSAFSTPDPVTTPPLDVNGSANTDTTTTITVSGGKVGERYFLENTVTTDVGRVLQASIEVRVVYLTIGVNAFCDLAFADSYFGPVEDTTWMALRAGEREAYLLRASRLLNRKSWIGDKTDPDQVLAWPRTGVDGVDPDEIPLQLKEATAELALALVNGDDIETRTTLNPRLLRSLSAGSVSITYAGAGEKTGPMPVSVMELLGPWLTTAGGSSSTSVQACGVDDCDPLKRGYGLTSGW